MDALPAPVGRPLKASPPPSAFPDRRGHRPEADPGSFPPGARQAVCPCRALASVELGTRATRPREMRALCFFYLPPSLLKDSSAKGVLG